MLSELFEDKEAKDLVFSLGLAALMILVIMLPKFCFKVSPKEF